VEECLDNDPSVKPTIAAVREKIQASKDDYIKEYPLDGIVLCQKGEQKDEEIKILKSEVDQLKLQFKGKRSLQYYHIWCYYSSAFQEVHQ